MNILSPIFRMIARRREEKSPQGWSARLLIAFQADDHGEMEKLYKELTKTALSRDEIVLLFTVFLRIDDRVIVILEGKKPFNRPVTIQDIEAVCEDPETWKWIINYQLAFREKIREAKK